MDILFLIGRIVLAVFYVYSGFKHFRRLGMMAQYTKSQGVPAPAVAVAVSGLMLIFGGLSILLGAHPVVGVALVVIFLVPAGFMMHRFWGVDQQTAMMQKPHFMKNIALAGSALMFLAIPAPWPLSLGL
jgi:uncharacterized membrane protein YphA (DoxX/SURF4 family)